MQQQGQQKAPSQNSEITATNGRDPGPAVEHQPAPTTALATAPAGHAAPAATAEAPAKQQPLADFDAVCEQMAHGMAYKSSLDEADEEFLQVNGYKAMPSIRGAHQFVMRSFLPIKAGKQPVVAFRGTVPGEAQTLITDLDPSGIGMYQFTPNKDLIEGQMQAAAAHGKVVTTGHSLGGALAQIAAGVFPADVSQIVTFQSPGVSNEIVNKIKNWNASHPDQAINSEHVRVQGDLVPMGGQALTPGEVDTYQMQGGNVLAKHLAYPLAQKEAQEGHAVPNTNPTGGNVSLVNSETADQANASKSHIVDNARVGLGAAVYGGMAAGRAVGNAATAVGHAVGSAASAVGSAASSVGHTIYDGIKDLF